MDESTIQALLRAPLHKFAPEDWPDWYARVAGLLQSDQADIRASAVERLCMAAFWAEHWPAQGKRTTDETKRQRAAWLTGLIEEASRAHPDVIRLFLHQLRYQGDDAPFAEIILSWLRGLRDRQPAELPLDHIEGTIVLFGGIEPWSGQGLPPILDHASDYVRACAAHRLGRAGHGESEDGSYDAQFIAELTDKELARPGIAGPWWSATGTGLSDFDGLGFDPVDWMLGIIERRHGPEPEDMPFNGIDFHIHELAAGNPEAIRRLIAAGHTDIALMAATEIRDLVPAMTPLLCELAEHADARYALPAQIHLAHYHAVLHPRADPARIRHLPNWREGVDVFVIRYGEPDRFGYRAVIFPRDETLLDDARAWALVDAALPPELRGDLARNPLARYDKEPAPYQLGRDELRSYASGANIKLVGAIEGQGWRRVELSPGRLQMRGEPWNWPGG